MKTYKQYLLSTILTILIHTISQAKVVIFTYSYNRPDFIELQHKTFKKFLQDEYQFVVFNDARDPHLYKKIKETCKKLNIKCIKIPQEIHARPYLQRGPGESYDNPSVRNCNVVQYSLDHYGFYHDDIVVLLDSDMFLVKPFSIKQFMQNYDVAALPQSQGTEIRYLWIGLVFLNMATMPNKTTINFNCGKINDLHVDTGGYTHYYLQSNPTARVHDMNLMYTETLACDVCCQEKNISACTHNTLVLQQRQCNPSFIKFLQSGPSTGYHPYYMELLLDQTFLHYRSATNWNGKAQEYHRQKTKILTDFINEITK